MTLVIFSNPVSSVCKMYSLRSRVRPRSSNVNSFFGHLENNHKEEWSKTLFGKHSEMAGGKNEEVEAEKTEKNIKEATHEWTTVVGSNEKEIEIKNNI
mgnify:CR=1 FL=1